MGRFRKAGDQHQDIVFRGRVYPHRVKVCLDDFFIGACPMLFELDNDLFLCCRTHFHVSSEGQGQFQTVNVVITNLLFGGGTILR